jgi:nitric oxide reductase NorE protein
MNDVRPSDKEDVSSSVLFELPGDLMMWVLIVSELLVFGAALAGFLAVRAGQAAKFAADQALLSQTAGALNTLVLVTSGLFAALAVERRLRDERKAARLWLLAAAAGGLIFLVVKAFEYAAKWSAGIGIESSPFFTFYFLITGFHALHVLAGIVILGLVAYADSPRNMETGVAFWHMVDLVWVLLFPIIYLLR